MEMPEPQREQGTCGTLRMRGNAVAGHACVKLLEDGFVEDSHMGDRRGPSKHHPPSAACIEYIYLHALVT